MDTTVKQLLISSPAFADEADIPSRYTCDDEGINPPLRIQQIPADAKVLAIIMEDPDASSGTFDHWLEWNIDPVVIIDMDSRPGIGGTNSTGKTGYHPPCPPAGVHRYYFTVFALDKQLDIPVGSNKEELKNAMQSHIIAKGVLMGRYMRQNKS